MKNSNSKKITEHLLNRGFSKTTENPRQKGQGNVFIDGTCFFRIHDLTFIFWHENLNHFSLVRRLESPKGLPGSGNRTHEYDEILIPKPIYKTEDADLLISALT